MTLTPVTATARRQLTFWRARLDEPCFVYLVQGGVDMPVKVGVARDPVARLATLQTGNHLRLRLMVVAPGGQPLEHQLHRRFKAARIPGGEWFEGGGGEQLLTFVEQLERSMGAVYDGSGLPPDYTQFGLGPKEKRIIADPDLTVHQVDPEPVADEVAHERLKARWCRQ